MEAILSAHQLISIDLGDASQVSAARIGVQALARALDFDETNAGRVAIAVTEVATNVVRHGKGGWLFARALSRGEALGIEVLAVDDGPGMASFAASSRDGYSTRGSAGTGLGSMQRQSDEFDVYTDSGHGTALRMVFWDRETGPDASRYEIGAVCVPKEGETQSGDAWAFQEHAEGATFVVADGLGHGPDACIAAATAVQAFRNHAGESAIRILEVMHARLRPTRGAAVAVIRHERSAGEIAYAGVGNIAASVWQGDIDTRRAMVSHNGIVGHNIHRSSEYRYPWPAGALLVAASDGLETHWDMSAHPRLGSCHPAIIAAVLYREHSRKRDDVCVLVVRQRN